MCGLFGFLDYSGKDRKDLRLLTQALASEAGVRGTDATGVAYFHKGLLQIQKEAKSPYLWKTSHPDSVRALIGHTRKATQGSAKQNRNNHPFSGKAGKTRFALAHNGILTNDDYLRRHLRLPKTDIETDSYIAVQLLEHEQSLSQKALKNMAETVDGSFAFSILDDRNNLTLIKGDSPLTLLHFPKQKMYVYASTDGILWRALTYTFLFDDLKEGDCIDIPIRTGDILTIRSDGSTEKSTFEYYRYTGYPGYYPSYYTGRSENTSGDFDDSYLQQLRQTAEMLGVRPETVDFLLEDGFTPEEIEEYIYEDESGEEVIRNGGYDQESCGYRGGYSDNGLFQRAWG